MALKKGARVPDRPRVRVFLWEGRRDVALAQARSGGCVLALWFTLAQAREKGHQEFVAWLEAARAAHKARFGKIAAA